MQHEARSSEVADVSEYPNAFGALVVCFPRTSILKANYALYYIDYPCQNGLDSLSNNRISLRNKQRAHPTVIRYKLMLSDLSDVEKKIKIGV